QVSLPGLGGSFRAALRRFCTSSQASRHIASVTASGVRPTPASLAGQSAHSRTLPPWSVTSTATRSITASRPLGAGGAGASGSSSPDVPAFFFLTLVTVIVRLLVLVRPANLAAVNAA